MDPRVRLERKYPGEGRFLLSPIEERLLARDREGRAPRREPGQTLRGRVVKIRAVWRTADPTPNAPLLKRIVRYPYRLETTYGRRFRVFEAGMIAREHIHSLPPAARVARAARGEMVWGNPLRQEPPRLARRVIPSVAEWLAGVAE